MRHGTQRTLFDIPKTFPNGLVYRPDFLSKTEEKVVLAYLQNLPLEYSRLDKHVSKRRVAGFGWGYDFATKTFIPGEPLPTFLQPLQRKVAKWLGISTEAVAEALVTEYSPGAAIGWHRDNEAFEHIVGISLQSWCRMRFRPMPNTTAPNKRNILSLELEPRSAYIMQKEIRWEWQHSIPPVKDLRYSITFRTLPKHKTPPPARAGGPKRGRL